MDEQSEEEENKNETEVKAKTGTDNVWMAYIACTLANYIALSCLFKKRHSQSKWNQFFIIWLYFQVYKESCKCAINN